MSPLAQPAPDDKRERDDWRRDDRALFQAVVDCTHLTSDGTTWMAGTHTTARMYVSLTTEAGIDWPGRYLDACLQAAPYSPTAGVDAFLDRNGLTRTDAPATL